MQEEDLSFDKEENNEGSKFCTKKIIIISSCIVVAVILILAISIPIALKKTKYKIHFTAKELIGGVKMGWNLGNTLEVSGTYDEWLANKVPVDPEEIEQHWGNPLTTQELINYVKSLGFDSIRIPVTWYNHCDENWRVDPKWMSRVKEVVNYCLNAKLTCIINVHHDTGRDGWMFAYTDKESQTKQSKMFKELWQQISDEFKDFPNEFLMFEGFNEILDTEHSWSTPSNVASLEYVNELNQIFVDTVRSSGSNNTDRVLICNTYCAGNYGDIIGKFEFPKDSAKDVLVFQVHAYIPYSYTSGEDPILKQDDKDSIAYVMKSLGEKVKGTNIPVIIGEFGAKFTGGTDESKVEWLNVYLTEARKNGVHCYYWDNGGNDGTYQIVVRESLTIKHESVLNALIK